MSKALQLNIRCTMSDEAWLARVRCVCVCMFHVGFAFCESFSNCLTTRTLINHILFYVFYMQNDSKSTDRIFQLYGVPALLAPANLLYRFD